MTEDELNKLFENSNNIPEISRLFDETPCILDIDVDCPEELHDKHNEYPFLPERIEVDPRPSAPEKICPN